MCPDTLVLLEKEGINGYFRQQLPDEAQESLARRMAAKRKGWKSAPGKADTMPIRAAFPASRDRLSSSIVSDSLAARFRQIQCLTLAERN